MSVTLNGIAVTNPIWPVNNKTIAAALESGILVWTFRVWLMLITGTITESGSIHNISIHFFVLRYWLLKALDMAYF